MFDSFLFIRLQECVCVGCSPVSVVQTCLVVLPITVRPIWKGRLPRLQARATQLFVVRRQLRRSPPAFHIVATIGLQSLALAQGVRWWPVARAFCVEQYARLKPMANTPQSPRSPAVGVCLAGAPTLVWALLRAPVLARLAMAFGKHAGKTLANVQGRLPRQDVCTHARVLHAQPAGAVRVQPTRFVHGFAPRAVGHGGEQFRFQIPTGFPRAKRQFWQY